MYVFNEESANLSVPLDPLSSHPQLGLTTTDAACSLLFG